jgi:cysteine-rich repeat protein
VPIAVHPAGCGDGERAGDEQCDDGNWTDGDGCDGVCVAETAPLCAGAPVLQIGDTSGDFIGAPSSFVGVCAGSFDTPERVYEYVATTTSLTISVASPADVSLYANSGACPGAKAEGCTEKNGAGAGETLTLVTTPGEELTFFVELRMGQPDASTYTITLSDP